MLRVRTRTEVSPLRDHRKISEMLNFDMEPSLAVTVGLARQEICKVIMGTATITSVRRQMASMVTMHIASVEGRMTMFADVDIFTAAHTADEESAAPVVAKSCAVTR